MAKKKTAKKTENKRKTTTKIKKTSKKKLAKPKTTIRVKVSKKVLGEAPQEYEFVLNDGRRLKSIQQLTNALETMENDLFDYHVNDMRNDFANWVDEIFHESELANEMRKTKSKMETRIKLLQKLVDEVIAETKKK